MKSRSRILFLILTLTMASCTGFNQGAMLGLIPNTNPAKEYALSIGYYKGGAIVHKNSTVGQTANNAQILKTSAGEACTSAVLGLFAFGDSSIEAAKKSAGITKVASVELRTAAIFAWLFHQHCTVVTGE